MILAEFHDHCACNYKQRMGIDFHHHLLFSNIWKKKMETQRELDVPEKYRKD